MADQTPSAVNQVERPSTIRKPALTILLCYSREGTYPDFPDENMHDGDAIVGTACLGEAFFSEFRKCKTPEERMSKVERELRMLFQCLPIDGLKCDAES